MSKKRKKGMVVKPPATRHHTAWKPAVAPKTPAVNSIGAIYSKIPDITDPKNPLIITMTPEVFGSMLAAYRKAGAAETAGYFDINDEGIIDWMFHDPSAKGTPGSVNYGTAEALIAYQERFNTDGYPRGQWHTHPKMSVYWSITDKTAQLETIEEMAANEEEGYFYFIVFDEVKGWLLTIIDWKEGKPISREDGTVMVNDVTMERSTYVATTTYRYKGGKPKAITAKAASPSKHAADPYDDPYGVPYGVPYYDDEEWIYDQKFKRGHESLVIPGKSSLIDDDWKNWDNPLNPTEVITSPWKGNQSSRDSFYDDLFDMFNVTRYDWNGLHSVITRYFPTDYFKIVDKRTPWATVKAALNNPRHNGRL